MASKHTPIIGITLGDVNGIGPEVVIKALADSRILNFFTPVIYGSSRVLSYYKKLLDINDFNYAQVKEEHNFLPKKTNVVNCWEEAVEITPGVENKVGGETAWKALKMASEDLRDGYIDAIVTAPINKANIQSEEFKFPGHTEYFANLFEVSDALMFMVSEQLRVGVVSGHVPLSEATGKVTKKALEHYLTAMEQSLKLDFGIAKPRIAVLGLNPHAGEEGLLGDKEEKVIKPVVTDFKKHGKLFFGPFPSDGFFGSKEYKKYDAVLAMYHDQGLIPFKSLSFGNGVNFTAGLPVVRTSPDHGTAYSIAGKNEASEDSMRTAIMTALDIVKNRRETAR
ncbi:MAG: 4-hydroxythreonine-4-phosphate dehydrogenase PdxA [Cyclobacteriaceae bacterium]|nr:4-hydroxythreonine-4-phosphate dehydrogenase PdxA [Cyclobacteriaceae bacterium]